MSDGGDSKVTLSECSWEGNNGRSAISFINYCIFSLSVCLFITVLSNICIIEHSKRRVNKLTLRPWRVAMLTVVSVALKAISNEVYVSWNVWLVIERFCKLCNVYFGLTLIQEKHLLSLFMIYQANLPVTRYDVMKDRFRDVEHRSNR